MRAQSDAIMIGIGTALADDPLLTCRLPGMESYSPVRIVLDSALRLPQHSRLAQSARQVPLWVIAGPDASRVAEEALRGQGVEVLRSPAHHGRIDLAAALKLIAARGITRLMVEGGPMLAAAFLAADLVDEVHLFRSPTVLGADGIDALDGVGKAALAWQLRQIRSDQVGVDRQDTHERR
jgi:diaminohydroxyphosphoribosylaminopyrimidine deaminase / 5-amino-6-(5-phosphoribosylamino)uracil reductase